VEICKLHGFATNVTIFSFFTFIMLEKMYERAREDEEVVLNLLILRDH